MCRLLDPGGSFCNINLRLPSLAWSGRWRSRSRSQAVRIGGQQPLGGGAGSLRNSKRCTSGAPTRRPTVAAIPPCPGQATGRSRRAYKRVGLPLAVRARFSGWPVDALGSAAMRFHGDPGASPETRRRRLGRVRDGAAHQLQVGGSPRARLASFVEAASPAAGVMARCRGDTPAPRTPSSQLR